MLRVFQSEVFQKVQQVLSIRPIVGLVGVAFENDLDLVLSEDRKEETFLFFEVLELNVGKEVDQKRRLSEGGAV